MFRMCLVTWIYVQCLRKLLPGLHVLAGHLKEKRKIDMGVQVGRVPQEHLFVVSLSLGERRLGAKVNVGVAAGY